MKISYKKNKSFKGMKFKIKFKNNKKVKLPLAQIILPIMILLLT